MSNRNFDSRVITQRLQDQNNAQNLFKMQKIGSTLITNPQNTDPSSQRISSYLQGTGITNYTTLQGGIMSSPSGIQNIVEGKEYT